MVVAHYAVLAGEALGLRSEHLGREEQGVAQDERGCVPRSVVLVVELSARNVDDRHQRPPSCDSWSLARDKRLPGGQGVLSLFGAAGGTGLRDPVRSTARWQEATAPHDG